MEPSSFIIALVVLLVLSVPVIFAIQRFATEKKLLLLLFFITLVVHVATATFITVTHFYPFGGGEGDQLFYHRAAKAIAGDFRQGDFSWESIRANLEREATPHLFPVVIGALYALTLPEKIVGQMLSVWFLLLSVLLVYFIAKELGASDRRAFWSGLIAALYPSYLYFGSLILRESMVAFFFLLSILLVFKLFRHFSWILFSFLYLALIVLIHLRFYIGLPLLFAFVIAWLIFFQLNWRKKLIYGVIVIPLLGFTPQISGHGYYGITELQYFLKPQNIVAYKEYVSSAPSPHLELIPISKIIGKEALSFPSVTPEFSEVAQGITPTKHRVAGSTVGAKVGFESPVEFIKNFVTSFVFVIVGPFPWHIRYLHQLLALTEAIPWYILSFFILRGAIIQKNQWRMTLFIILVSMGIFAIIALFINNYGTYMRIRIPAFLILFTLFPFAFESKPETRL